MSNAIPENALAEFYAEADEIIQRVTSLLSHAESKGLTDDSVDSLYRDIHTLKGSAQLFGFKNIGLISHALEASLEPVRKKKILISPSLLDHLFKCLDLIDKLIKTPDKDLGDDQATKLLIQKLITELIVISTGMFNGNHQLNNNDQIPKEDFKKLKLKIDSTSNVILKSEIKMTNLKTVQQPVNGSQNYKKDQDTTQESTGGEASTIRVQVGLLDRLMNLVGEMVLVRNQVLQYSLKSDDYEFLNLSQRLDLVTSELQEDVMKTRMQPIGSVLTKFQRVVRDISKDLGKQIELVIKGSETEIDKSLLEAIKDPLTHIIRNSCDHGLETTQERISAHKTEIGHIYISAYHEGGQVVIEIRDDGRGLNLKRILEKAIDKKIISPDKAIQLTDREISYLIFAPGFSTAESVSSLSGRGVGMDVVRTNIEKVGGIVDLSSENGKGTTIRLRIPLTLAIVPAMIVKSKTELFAIPQVKLQELVRVDMDESEPKIEFLQGQAMYRLRGQLLPLVFMDETLNLIDDIQKRKIYNIVVLSNEGIPFGLVVDEIRDTADIVVKPLTHFLKKLNLYSGATIMGDGNIALIIDVMGIAEKAKVINQATKRTDNLSNGTIIEKVNTLETQELLFFELNSPGKFGIPLTLVQRLEEFDYSEIEQTGKEKVVKYRGSLLSLINLNDFLNFKNNEKNEDKGKASVIVVSKRRKLFGIQVNQILDVVNVSGNIETPLKEQIGILGSVISNEGIATVVDVLNIIEEILDGNNHSTVKVKKSNLGAKKVSKKIKILFVEDTLFFVRQVTHILSTQGYEVTHAIDGIEALKILKSNPPNTFDLILSDIEMPNMNGYDLVKNIRNQSEFNNVPIVALTTRFREDDIEKGLKLGFNKYLEKINTDELIDTVNLMLNGGKSA